MTVSFLRATRQRSCANSLTATEEQSQRAGEMLQQFQSYAPGFTKPITAEESVTAVLSVMHKASIEAGNGGSFVSHFGNKQWL